MSSWPIFNDHTYAAGFTVGLPQRLASAKSGMARLRATRKRTHQAAFTESDTVPKHDRPKNASNGPTSLENDHLHAQVNSTGCGSIVLVGEPSGTQCVQPQQDVFHLHGEMQIFPSQQLHAVRTVTPVSDVQENEIQSNLPAVQENEIQPNLPVPVLCARRNQNTNASRRQAATRKRSYRSAFTDNAEVSDTLTEHYCGKMDVICPFCHSKNFPKEKPSDGKFSKCCHKGKVKLEPLRPVPDYLRGLLTGNDDDSKHFRENSRAYNSALAFASLGAQISPPPGYGPYCFRIHGQIYHRTSAAHPNDGQIPKYAQLYILNSDEALNHRVNYNSQCRHHIMENLDAMIRENNPYAEAYKMMHEVEQEEEMTAQAEGREISPVSMFIVQDKRDDQRRYNAPRCNEVAIVFRNSDGEPPFHWDIRVHSRNQPLRNISILDGNCDPMCYPVFFPCGGQGWKIGRVAQFDNTNDPIGLTSGNVPQNPNDKRCISHLQFYSHRLAVRVEESGEEVFNPILCGGPLTQQFTVDAYCKTEGNRLEYIRQNQKKLRVASYSGLQDHLNNAAENEGVQPGEIFVLPSTFPGSPRNMMQNFQDAMAIVRRFGKPDIFMTVTCNPAWMEVTENVLPYQKSQDRPDIVSRVFNLKLRDIKSDICEKHVLGLYLADVHVIEFQKRGLPHCHILLILNDCDKIRDNETIDKIVSAEIPDEKTHPKLHEIVRKTMIHGPCGKDYNRNSPCLDEHGVCTKGFPKEFCETTNGHVDGYPIYRRRNDGRTMTVGKYVVDNRWIVPYNPWFLEKYGCHINLEICGSIKSVKYLYKYVYKGHDCANVVIRQGSDEVMNHDEPSAYLDARYVSAPEAMWRLLELPMHHRSHAIIRLAVHLQDEQHVYFHEGDEAAAANRARQKPTMLTDWFELNKRDPSANQYLYPDVPNHYVFDGKQGWKKRSLRHDKIIGRMYTVSPMDSERYHLRLLLLHVEGAKCYTDLKTVDGVVSTTFKEACRLRNLLADDSEWDNCLSEAIVFQMPRQLRQLFATIAFFASRQIRLSLWEKHREYLIEDYLRTNSAEVSEQKALRDVEDFLLQHRKQCKDFGLPEPPAAEPEMPENSMFDVETERLQGLEKLATLNDEQRTVHDKVMLAVTNDQHPRRCFFIEGAGGTGKTHVYKTLMHTVRGMGLTVLAVAWTGIAATLLKGGRTVHSQFKLPIPVDERAVCKVKGKSSEADEIRKAKLIIWDEVTMAPSYALNAINVLLKDLMNDPRPFGGKVILLGGDFRQCLPVLKHSHRVGILGLTVKNSSVWASFEQLSLSLNMRTLPEEKEFADWLLQLGHGDLKNDLNLGDDIIPLPQNSVVEDSLIKHVFGDTITPDQVHQMSTRAILCPKNEDSLKLNDKIIKDMVGEPVTYKSVDSVQRDDLEFLKSLTTSGMPHQKLVLKEGAIIMLLRNMNVKKGLCNGTRMVVRKMLTSVIDAEILTGTFKGDRVFIPRIELAPSDTDLPFILRRRQYPIRVSFAMTINKAQGQTFDKVGIYLPSPVFTHGQLYVAFSRARSQNDVKVEVGPSERQGKLTKGSDDTFTVNVVFKEVFA